MAIKDKIKNVLKKDSSEGIKSSASTNDKAAAPSKSTPAPSSIEIPPASKTNGQSGSVSHGPKTPKTPQDEAIAFFSSNGADGQPVQVWELWLEDDGGPGSNKSVRTSPL